MLNRIVLLCLVILTTYPYTYSLGAGREPRNQFAPGEGITKEQPRRPSKIYESTSGYVDGMRGRGGLAEESSNADSKKQRRKPIELKQSNREPLRKLEQEKALARTRMQRHEWDLAVSTLERALETATKLRDTDEIAALQELVQEARQKALLAKTGKPESPGEITNEIGMKMVIVPAGTFTMGSSRSDRRRIQNDWGIAQDLVDREGPSHRVRIGNPFLIGKYEVTAGQFKQFVDETGYKTVAETKGWGWIYDESKKHWIKKSGASWVNPGYEVWEDDPVTVVSQADADAFCQWLSKKDGRKYSLPTEAQWEYAARGGKDGERFPWGDAYPDGGKLNTADRRSPVPWADRTVDDQHSHPAPVGSYEPNDFRLYDMMGNVWELCSDKYSARAYAGSESGIVEDPSGPARGKNIVVRGGNWAFGPAIARNAFRAGVPPDLAADVSGFRVTAEAQPGDTPLKKETLESVAKGPVSGRDVSRLVHEVKNLAATGKRIEARRLVEKISAHRTSNPDTLENPNSFVQDVLNSVIDLTAAKNAQSFTNSLGMEMIRIPAGAFVMGSSEADIAWAITTLAQGQPLSLENEYPFHKVRISRPFLISSTEVTVGQFRKFVEETGYVTDAEDMGGGQVFDTREGRFEREAGTNWKKPGWKVTSDQPVTMVSYNDAQAFAEWLSAKEKVPYKLPTEAQWEYAARGGLPMAQFPWGDDLQDGRRANFADRNTDFEWRDRNADDGYKYVAPVGSYEPNGFGLYDMAGNVLEWVRDYYGEDYYRYTPEIDPEGPGHGENRVTKGGEWTFGPVNLRCAFRGWSRPDLAFYNTGFRVAIELSNPLRTVHFADDFLTRKWVPGSDHRAVAEAVAREKERQPEIVSVKTTPSTKPTIPDAPQVRGLRILSFSPKSDGRKAGLQKGDVIIEYHGTGELTSDKFLALTAKTRRERIRPILVFIRDGYEHSVRVARGFLGITILDTNLRGPFKKKTPLRRSPDRKRKEKTTKPLDWT
jgi:sulfatase modifying factor 1